MNAWLYLVVSSQGQAETLEFQKQWAEETASANGWTVERVFSAVSTGKHGVRKLLQSLISELQAIAKTKRPQRILMVRLDRLGRGDALDVMAAIAEIRKLGVTIHTRDDGDVRLETVTDTIMPMLKSITSGIENAARSDKARAGAAKRRQEGKHHGHAPYGVKLQNGLPVPDAPRAAIVRKMFAMRATGAGYERIAHALGPTAPPKPQADGSTRKIGWHRTFIRSVLACRTYRGVVIPEDLWDRVQLVRNPDFKDRAVLTFPWPLTGIVKCTCGMGLTGKASGGNCQRCKGDKRKHNHARIRYYLCNNPIAHPGKRPHLRADRLEKQFIEFLERLAAQPELIDLYRRTGNVDDTAGMSAQLHDLERDMQRLIARRRAAWDLQSEGHIDPAELSDRLEELRIEHDDILARMDAIKRALSVSAAQATVQKDAARVLRRASKRWPQASVVDQKEIARLLAAAVGGLRIDQDNNLCYGRDGSTRNISEQMLPQLPLRLLSLERMLSERPTIAPAIRKEVSA